MVVGFSAARLVHAENVKAVTNLVNQLKLARAKMKASGDVVAREVIKEERAKLAKLTPQPKAAVGKVVKAVVKQGKICKPFVPAKRGRPSSGECYGFRGFLLG